MSPKLKPDHKKALRNSSRLAVQQTFSGLKRYFRRGKWIGSTNRYRINCTEFIRRDTQPNPPTINNTHLAQYIAASVPLHCMDGWSFLGRALECHAHGDSDSARHFGYYAELRGAMCLLAAEGIGIFDDRHFVIDDSRKCQPIGPLPRPGRPGSLRTHSVTWLALEHWSDLKRSTDLLAKVVRPGGRFLREWLDALGMILRSGNPWQPIGRKWLKAWGLDLQYLVDDRDARNLASYRPTHLSHITSLDVSDASQLMRGFWEICDEITSQSPFENLDRHLLRLSLKVGFKAITGRSAESDQLGFETCIAGVLGVVGISEAYAKELSAFLIQDTNELMIISEAAQSPEISDSHHHIQVMARAALLLRVATGASAQILRETGSGGDDLGFWWKPLGLDRGLWEAGDEPTELANLWADIETAIEDMRRWENDKGKTKVSYARWQRELSSAISILGGCERIGLWGLGL